MVGGLATWVLSQISFLVRNCCQAGSSTYSLHCIPCPPSVCSEGHVQVVIINNVPLFFQQRDGPWCPTLRVLHQYPDMMKKLRADKVQPMVMKGSGQDSRMTSLICYCTCSLHPMISHGQDRTTSVFASHVPPVAPDVEPPLYQGSCHCH
jgi:hypothetical protein